MLLDMGGIAVGAPDGEGQPHQRDQGQLLLLRHDEQCLTRMLAAAVHMELAATTARANMILKTVCLSPFYGCPRVAHVRTGAQRAECKRGSTTTTASAWRAMLHGCLVAILIASPPQCLNSKTPLGWRIGKPAACRPPGEGRSWSIGC